MTMKQEQTWHARRRPFAAVAMFLSLRKDMQTSNTRVSATFHRGAMLGQTQKPDVTLVTTEGTLFFVHSAVLLHASRNQFAGLLPAFAGLPTPGATSTQAVVVVGDDAASLNIVLHTAYALSLQHFAPTFRTLERAVASMLDSYGFTPDQIIFPNGPLFTALMNQVTTRHGQGAKDVFALAAQRNLEVLAVAASEYLLDIDLTTDTVASNDFCDALGECSVENAVIECGTRDRGSRLSIRTIAVSCAKSRSLSA
jgi:hypothetical protein